jgi:cephalosporin hydroxylase
VTDRLIIDLEARDLIRETDAGTTRHPLDSPDGFALLSREWLLSGWQTKQVYTFTWLGRPIIQLPEDMFRAQEVVYRLKPDVIVETGIAHGGSLIFYASVCHAIGHGRVIGVEIEIRPHNRAAIEAHELSDRITLIEGDSIADEVVAEVRSCVAPGESALVMLDGKHTKAHVLAELEAYAPLVPVGSYIVAADTLMQDMAGLRRWRDDSSTDDWSWNNPREAAREFAARRDDFSLESPVFAFNESPLSEPVSYWASGWLKRIRQA